MYTMKFRDGSELSGLTSNGTDLVSEVEVNREDLARKMGRVEITSDGDDDLGLAGVHEHLELRHYAHYTQEVHGMPDGWYLEVGDVPEGRILRGDVDYMSMMLGVEL